MEDSWELFEKVYFGPDLKDCISPEGQLLVDASAKKALFKASPRVSLNRC